MKTREELLNAGLELQGALQSLTDFMRVNVPYSPELLQEYKAQQETLRLELERWATLSGEYIQTTVEATMTDEEYMAFHNVIQHKENDLLELKISLGQHLGRVYEEAACIAKRLKRNVFFTFNEQRHEVSPKDSYVK